MLKGRVLVQIKTIRLLSEPSLFITDAESALGRHVCSELVWCSQTVFHPVNSHSVSIHPRPQILHHHVDSLLFKFLVRFIQVGLFQIVFVVFVLKVT